MLSHLSRNLRKCITSGRKPSRIGLPFLLPLILRSLGIFPIYPHTPHAFCLPSLSSFAASLYNVNWIITLSGPILSWSNSAAIQWSRLQKSNLPEAPTSHHLYGYLSTPSYSSWCEGLRHSDVQDRRSRRGEGRGPEWHPGLHSLNSSSKHHMIVFLLPLYGHMGPVCSLSWTTPP